MVWHRQVAVVTGASRGIGRAVARELAARGASVCVNYVSQAEAAASLVDEISGQGGRALSVMADVADAGEAKRLIDRANDELGPVTILVNNAGVISPGTLDTYDAAAFDRMRRVNVDGIIHTMRAVADGMRQRRYGCVVNMSSIGGIGTAVSNNAFYATTKAAVIMLTKRFARELGPFGITVNAVAPGFILTEMTREWLKSQPPDVEHAFAERTMMRRNGKIEDIAHAVAFLASPESSWITAQVLTVDGGRMDYV